jgi:hypothetical protein
VVAAQTLKSSSAASAALKYLEYLVSTWMSLAMWRSWSHWGRLAVLGKPLEGVFPTTNHLKSFNSVLKHKHITQWQHSGHRLRFDSFILLLITQILPCIYSQRQFRKDYAGWLRDRFQGLSGDVDLVAQSMSGRPTCRSVAVIGWWNVDTKRDNAAWEIVSRASGKPEKYLLTLADLSP